jgi:rhomboid protease GluP
VISADGPITPSKPVLTWWLIALNVLAYVAMIAKTGHVTAFTTPELLHWGGDLGVAVFQGQYWRMLTSAFLHAGLMHIAGNMYFLWQLGLLTEQIVGSWKMLVLYLIAALASSALSILIHPYTVSVGASGAIFGLAGALLVFARRKIRFGNNQMLVYKGLLQFVGWNIVLGFVIPAVDNAAHIGGLIAGLVIGMVFTNGLLRHALGD